MKILYVALLSVMFTNSVVGVGDKIISIYAPIPIKPQSQINSGANMNTKNMNLEQTPIQKKNELHIDPLEYDLSDICDAYINCYLTYGSIPQLGYVDCSEIPESFEFVARELIYLMNRYTRVFDSVVNSIAKAYDISPDTVRKLYKDCNYLCYNYSYPEKLYRELDYLLEYEFTMQTEAIKLAIERLKKHQAEQQSQVSEVDIEPNPFDDVD